MSNLVNFKCLATYITGQGREEALVGNLWQVVHLYNLEWKKKGGEREKKEDVKGAEIWRVLYMPGTLRKTFAGVGLEETV